MTVHAEERLKQLGISLPKAGTPAAKYANYVIVKATTDYEEHHKVLNGFSDLMLEVFGDQGIHARSVFGAVSLRDQLPVIVDSIFQVEE